MSKRKEHATACLGAGHTQRSMFDCVSIPKPKQASAVARTGHNGNMDRNGARTH